MHYIIGDIHGYYDRLVNLFTKLAKLVTDDDTVIFLGDYIDRGAHSYEVIDFLVYLRQSETMKTVFLKGNHEDMFMSYLKGEDGAGSFLFNGGDATLRSYAARGADKNLPGHHREFFGCLRLFYEGEDFIAVHAGLNPRIDSLESQDEHDLLWIREKFFRADRRWSKTVIFGHTPVTYLSGGPVYIDEARNIIGIDSGVIFGKPLTCLAWPERRIITG
ncbi:MAG: serine/threonine protein phosphatase [Spirochaetes bacterium]|nr:serine/threonine protein phosphatase [Spirochaetota bacterium]